MLVAADAGTWALVAVTGALALVTGGMAWSTRNAAHAANRTAEAAERDIRQGAELVKIGQDQVDAAQRQVVAAQRQADLAQRALEAERQPVLVPTTSLEQTYPEKMYSFDSEGIRSREYQDFPTILCVADITGAWVILKIRNVGRGPGIIGKSPGDLFLQPFGGQTVYGLCHSRVLAPDDRAVLIFRSDPEPNDQQSINTFAGSKDPTDFTVQINYTDISYARRYRGRFTFNRDRPQPRLMDATVETQLTDEELGETSG